MSMGGMALPPGIAQQMMAQQGPTPEEQLRVLTSQVAVSTFNVEHNDEKLTDESLIRRAAAIEEYVREGKTAVAPTEGIKPSEDAMAAVEADEAAAVNPRYDRNDDSPYLPEGSTPDAGQSS